MPDKPKYAEAGMDPFTYARAEKKAKKEKQNLAEIRNQVNAVKPGDMKDIKILGQREGDLKRKSDTERTDLRKREHKALMKNLTLA